MDFLKYAFARPNEIKCPIKQSQLCKALYFWSHQSSSPPQKSLSIVRNPAGGRSQSNDDINDKQIKTFVPKNGQNNEKVNVIKSHI